MENDFEEKLDNETVEENNTEFVGNIKSSSTRASKRPIQRSDEPLDIEPVEDKKLFIENLESESIEIDDPW